jgi:hypothetical protein
VLKGESNKQRLPHLSFLKNAYKTDNYPFGRFKKRSYPQGFLCFAFFVLFSFSLFSNYLIFNTFFILKTGLVPRFLIKLNAVQQVDLSRRADVKKQCEQLHFSNFVDASQF